jgi:malate dehydrogenase
LKLAIIGGAGLIGSNAAFEIAKQNLVSHISLIDVRQNVAKSHEMDMEQALCGLSETTISSGGFEQLEGADLVMLAVGQVGQMVTSTDQEDRPTRMSLLSTNYRIVAEIAPQIRQHCPNAIIINMTNPLDVINTVLPDLTGIQPHKIIGFSLNDTTRFRWALSKITGEPFSAIQATVLGEHGESQVPLYSQIYIHGQKVELSPEQKNNVSQILDNWFAEHAALKAGRSSGWLSAVNAARILKILTSNSNEIIPCSAIGPDGISIGQAVQLNREGIARIIDLPLSEEEKEQLHQAKQKVAQAVQSVHIV